MAMQLRIHDVAWLGLLSCSLATGCQGNVVTLGNDQATDATEGTQGDRDAGTPRPDASDARGVDLLASWSLTVDGCPLSVQRAGPTYEAKVENRGNVASPSLLVRVVSCGGTCGPADLRQTLVEQIIPEGLAPGEGRPLVIPGFASPAGAIGPWQLLIIADPDNAIPELDETNNQGAPVSMHNGLRIFPAAVDFGTVCVGTGGEASLTIQNVDTQPITIEGWHEIAGSHEVAWQLPPVPLTLAPGISYTVSAHYAPTDVGRDQGMLVISRDRSACPEVVSFSGEGMRGPTQNETFEQRQRPTMDVLVVLESSSAIVSERGSILANMPLLLNSLLQRTIDFHLAVTTADIGPNGSQGRLLGAPAFIDATTPNSQANFAARVDVGASGTATNQGLEATRLALTPPLATSANLGFLRSDASLALIYVSAGDDASPLAVADYEALLKATKVDPSEARADAVIRAGGTNCGPTAQRYLDLVAATGGLTTELCIENWDSVLGNLQRDNFGLRRRFVLATTTNLTAASIQVSVDQNVVPASSFSFDPTTRALTFAPTAVPGPGATIVVSYPTQCL